MKPFISIIIPVLNEQAQISLTLETLAAFRDDGHEVIVVDGGSQDNTCSLAIAQCDQLLHARQAGRAAQMNLGAQHARGEVLLFLHADTLLPPDATSIIQTALESPAAQWGRFDVQLSGESVWFRVIAWFMNLRSRVTGIATGDQALFIRRELFNSLQGYASLALMEDIEICHRLKKHSSPVCLRQKLITSSRRWEQRGILRTLIRMWSLRLSFFLGTSSEVLAKRYDA